MQPARARWFPPWGRGIRVLDQSQPEDSACSCSELKGDGRAPQLALKAWESALAVKQSRRAIVWLAATRQTQGITCFNLDLQRRKRSSWEGASGPGRLPPPKYDVEVPLCHKGLERPKWALVHLKSCPSCGPDQKILKTPIRGTRWSPKSSVT